MKTFVCLDEGLDECDVCRIRAEDRLHDPRTCRRDSSEAEAKRDARDGNRRWWAPSECWAAAARFHVGSMGDILKWHYPQAWGVGTYRQELMVEEIHRYEVRCSELRGTKPRHRYEVEKSLGMTRMGGIYAALYSDHPAFALIRKDATIGS